MLTFNPDDLSTKEMYQLMIGAVTPRPIGFISTISKEGVANLAPYSFFNAFSTKPPVVAFAASTMDKDTFINVKENQELVVNVVTHSIIRQMAIASIRFPAGVNEFQKSGLTPIASDLVQPARVKESPIHFECRVRQIISFGETLGAGQMVICDVLKLHVSETILDERGRIHPHKADIMGRLGRAYYVRASGEAVHTVYQPSNKISIGFDQLPDSVKFSNILTGNNLGQLAGIIQKPTVEAIEKVKAYPSVQTLLDSASPIEALHKYAQRELTKERTDFAAQLVWLADELASSKA